jgi:hypothetical protein
MSCLTLMALLREGYDDGDMACSGMRGRGTIAEKRRIVEQTRALPG